MKIPLHAAFQREQRMAITLSDFPAGCSRRMLTHGAAHRNRSAFRAAVEERAALLGGGAEVVAAGGTTARH